MEQKVDPLTVKTIKPNLKTKESTEQEVLRMMVSDNTRNRRSLIKVSQKEFTFPSETTSLRK